MIWNNHIGTDYLISPKMCEEIIEIGEQKLNNNFGIKEINYRIDEHVLLTNFGSYKNSKNFIEIDKIILDCVSKFLEKYCPNINVSQYNHRAPHKFQKAESNGGFFTWHCEAENDRAFVWMLYLNTIEKGGRTQFLQQDENVINIKPEQGKFIFWPAGETHFHRSSPDLEETKYILTGWVYRK
jgi:hypothetical protein